MMSIDFLSLAILKSQMSLINVRTPDVEIFDCRLGQKKTDTEHMFPYMFPASTLHACAVRLERSGNRGGQWEQAKAEWISLFCLQISFFLWILILVCTGSLAGLFWS